MPIRSAGIVAPVCSRHASIAWATVAARGTCSSISSAAPGAALHPTRTVMASSSARTVDLLRPVHEGIHERVRDAVEHRIDEAVERAARELVAHGEFDSAGLRVGGRLCADGPEQP